MSRRSLLGFRPSLSRFYASNTTIKSHQETHHSSTLSSYTDLLRTCLKSKSLKRCKQIHSQIITSGSILDIYLMNSLLHAYSKCGDLSHARQTFDQMSERNVVSWTSIITAFVHQGFFETALQIFAKMVAADQKPNQFTFSIAVRACTSLCFLDLGLQIHGLTITFGLDRIEFTGSSLVDMYSKLGRCDDARRVFCGLFYRDSVSWNVIISGLVQNENHEDALRYFSDMRISGSNPNDFTFTSLLKCCRYLKEVEQIHGCLLKSVIELDTVVGSALLDSYANCGGINSSRKILDMMSIKDGFTWSSAISGYTKNGDGEEALVLFREMCRQGLEPDQHSLSSALKACLEIQGLEIGIQIHTHMIKNGYQKDFFVASVLLILYSDFNKMGDAQNIFSRISQRDCVSWNSMIIGYAQIDGFTHACINLFRDFLWTGMTPDSFTFIAVLKSCRSFPDLSLGRQIHTQVVKSRQSLEIHVGNAVINMYAKCAAVDEARRAFDSMTCRDEISWSSVIGNYTQNQHGFEAVNLFNQMRVDRLQPNQFCFASIITACSSLAAMELGKQLHSSVIKAGFTSEIHVGSSLIDMYGKCGSTEDSTRAFYELKDPNLVSFNALISGFAQNGKAHEAIQIFDELKKLNINPNKITFLALLSACSHVGLVEESLCFFQSMYHEFGIMPDSEHYSCLVDVIGRAGKLEQAYEIANKVYIEPAVSVWRTLLSSCTNHGNLEIGEKSARKLLELEPDDHSGYVLLSNLYAEAGRWGEVCDLRGKMVETGVRKEPGSSYVIVRD